MPNPRCWQPKGGTFRNEQASVVQAVRKSNVCLSVLGSLATVKSATVQKDNANTFTTALLNPKREAKRRNPFYPFIETLKTLTSMMTTMMRTKPDVMTSTTKLV